MLSKPTLAILASIFFIAAVNADGLYSKNSAVLQVDGKSYNKLIAKSNQVSVSIGTTGSLEEFTDSVVDCRVSRPLPEARTSIETSPRFYAPWCGHCKNLKPKYEKAAKGLKDLAQVAAVNCDEEPNKAFCGTMGVQGFPTLKIVKPSKKPGKPTVEDYQGPREAKDIIEAVKSMIPNNVKRITDKGLLGWLDNSNETSKAALFSDKGTTSALVKVLANDFLGNMNFAQIRDKETTAVEMFGITEYPTLIVLPGGTQDSVKYSGAFSKEAMKSFLSEYASPVANSKDQKQKPMGEESEKPSGKKVAKEEKANESFSEASASQASSEASAEAAGATSVTLEDESNPTESPDPIVISDEKPIVIPEGPEPIPTLEEEAPLEQKCFGEKTSTCVLALLPAIEGEEAILPESATTTLASLAELAEKHIDRKGNLFPFFSIPASNPASANIRDALKLGGDKDFELIAVNARRGWVRHYAGERFDSYAIENWVDNIRFGEGAKSALPEELIVKAKTEEKPAEAEHGEL